MRKQQLAIMVPWETPFTWTKPAFNLMNLDRPDGYEVRYIQGSGWCPANRHNNCLIQAINWGADRLVFLGMDHHVDEDILVKLVAHIDERGYDAACGWIPSRGVIGKKEDGKPYQYVAFKKRSGAEFPHGSNPCINMDPEKFDVLHYGAESQEIDIIGTGSIMFTRDLVVNMTTPFFREFIQRSDNYARVPIQDSYWVWRLTHELGGRLWLDTTIKEVHLDIFPIDETYADRFEDFSDPHHYSPHSQLGVHDYEKKGHPRFRGSMQQSGDSEE